jgi:peptide/nickel transport system substrate-binding protein
MKRILAFFLCTFTVLSFVTAGGRQQTSPGSAYTPPGNPKKEYLRTWGSAPTIAQFTGHYQSSTGIGEMGGYVVEGLYNFVRTTNEIIPRLANGMPVHQGNTSTVRLKSGVRWNTGQPLTTRDIWAYYILNKDVRINTYLTDITYTSDSIIYTWADPVPSDVIKNCFIGENTANACVPYYLFGAYVDRNKELLDACPPLRDPNRKGPFGKDVSGQVDAFSANWQAYQLHEIPNKKPIGTGPYILESMTDTEFILRKWDGYHRAAEIKFDTIHNINVTAEQGIAMLRNGQSDSYPGSLPLDIAESVLRSNRDIVFYQTDDPASHGFYFNQKSKNAPMDKVEFRQAINYIIDKTSPREAGNYYGREFEYATTGVPPGVVGVSMSPEALARMRRYTPDPAKAEALLASIGVVKGPNGRYRNSDGTPIKIVLGVNAGWQPAGVVTNVTSIVCDQLKDFGFDAEVLAVENSVYATMMNGNTDFDMSFEWTDVAWSYSIPYFPLYSFYQDCSLRMGVSVDPVTNRINYTLRDWDGREFSPMDYLTRIPITNNEKEVQDMVDRLIWAANEYALGITLYQNATGVWENRGHTANLPMEDQISTGTNGFPQWMVQPEDPNDPNFAPFSKMNWGFSGIEKLLAPTSLAPQ